MNKKEALKKTKEQFTNLIDNTIVSGVSVHSIISYYEEVLADNSQPIAKKPMGNIEKRFLENKFKDFSTDPNCMHMWDYYEPTGRLAWLDYPPKRIFIKERFMQDCGSYWERTRD